MAPDPEELEEVDLLREGRPQQGQPLARRDLIVEGAVGGAFLIAAIGIALGFDAERDWHVGHAIVLCVLFAIAIRLNFDVGAGYTSPVQLVFVPMLLLLPTPWVPLLVAASWLLGKLPDHLSGRAHWTKAIFVLGNAWFSVGPALVLILGHAQTPDWSDWPVYLLALVAQIVFDISFGELREWAGRGVAPKLQLRMLGWVQLIDVLLAPLGLLAAFATEQADYAFLLLMPPAALLIVFSRERAARIGAALQLYETERDALRSREALIAGASHEMLTHLSVVIGLSRHLGRLDPPRRAEALGTMDRELLQLRHLARQFVDYTRTKAGRTPTVRLRAVVLRPLLDQVAGAFATRAQVEVKDEAGATASADPDRLEQVLMALVTNAVKFSPNGSPVALQATTNSDVVQIEIADRGPGIPTSELPRLFEELHRGEGVAEGAGVGLFLCRALTEAQGGRIGVAGRPGGGSIFTVTLPAAPAH